MKRVAGWVVTLLGIVVAVLGVAVMVVLGPDSRVTTGPHAIDTGGSVVVTAPRVIRWADVQVDVLAELPAQKPLFVGIGNTVDVESLVDGTARVEVTDFDTPWKPVVADRDGRPFVQGAPTALDWWYADAAGLGGASISAQLPDEPVSLAVISVGTSSLSGLEVTLAYGIRGGFAKGAGLVLLGVGGVLAGRVVRRSGLGGDELVEGDAVMEEVVYVVVDEDGVERELSAEEVAAGDFEVVEEPEPEPETGPVVYVFVDEDGVEHEIGEDELDDFEVVDDDEDGDRR
jgi:hypothetical protein